MLWMRVKRTAEGGRAVKVRFRYVFRVVVEEGRGVVAVDPQTGATASTDTIFNLCTSDLLSGVLTQSSAVF